MENFDLFDSSASFQLSRQPEVMAVAMERGLRYVQVDGESTRHCYLRSLEVV